MSQKLESAIRHILLLDSDASTIGEGELVCLTRKTRDFLVTALEGDAEDELDALIEDIQNEQAIPTYVAPESYYVPVRPSFSRASTERGIGGSKRAPALSWDDEDTLVEDLPFADTFVGNPSFLR